MHARGSGGAARRAKRGWQPEKKKESLSFFVPLPSRAIRHARGHLRVSRFARQTTQKGETARSLLFSLFLFKNHKHTFCLQVWQLLKRPTRVLSLGSFWSFQRESYRIDRQNSLLKLFGT